MWNISSSDSTRNGIVSVSASGNCSWQGGESLSDPSEFVTLIMHRLYQVESGSEAMLLVSTSSENSSGSVFSVSGLSGGRGGFGSYRVPGGGTDPVPSPSSFLSPHRREELKRVAPVDAVQRLIRNDCP